jgi:orotidine-5'-phosphate decarboxylase
VGLDPALEGVSRALGRRLGPGTWLEAAEGVWEFNQHILEAVRPYCGVVKPQSAFYEVLGPAGIEVLRRTIERARELELVCILDAKRNDIASTAAAYAQAYLGDGPLATDAITVNPYLGSDGIAPFLKVGRLRGRGIFALVKTSNPSSAEVQDARLEDGTLTYERVGTLVAAWGEENVGACGYGDVGAVVGATFPRQLAQLRAAMPRTWFLVPGYGTQGGTATDVAAAFDQDGLGGIVNSSSGILFAGRDRMDVDFAAAAGEAARNMRDDLDAALEARPH